MLEDRVRGKGSFISAVENKQSAVSVSVSFMIFLSFSVFIQRSGALLLSILIKRYQRFRCHCNEVLLKNAQLCNKTSCCIATKSRLTFLILAQFFLSKNETGFEYFGHFFEHFWKIFSIFPRGKISKIIQKCSQKSPKIFLTGFTFWQQKILQKTEMISLDLGRYATKYQYNTD